MEENNQKETKIGQIQRNLLNKVVLADIFYDYEVSFSERKKTNKARKEFDAIKNHYLKAIKKDDEHKSILCLEIGKYWLYEHQDYIEGIKLFTLSIDANPLSAEAFYQRAVSYFKMEVLEKSDEDCSQAILLNSKYYEAYNLRGMIALKRNDMGFALSFFNSAIDLNPELAKAYNNRAIVRSSLKLIEEAFLDFDKAIDIDPKMAEAYNNRGALRGRSGLMEEAFLDFDRAINLQSEYGNAYYNRGIVKYEAGKLKQAFLDYNKAIKFDPAHSLAYNNRGLIKIKLGNKKEALEDFIKSLQTDPHNHWAQENIEKILLYETLENRSFEILPDFFKRGGFISGLGSNSFSGAA